VNSDRLRFDFSHFAAMSQDEKDRVEQIVNAEILANDKVETRVMSVEDAKESGAMALFDEKYGNAVRVVSVGNYSRELCGGTHLKTTSQACLFKIVSESGVAAGIRRIEAVTGEEAMRTVQSQECLMRDAASLLKTQPADLMKRIEGLLADTRALEKRLEAQNATLSKSMAESLVKTAVEAAGLTLVFAVVETVNPDELRNLADKVRDRIQEGAVVLASIHGDKVSLVAMATKNAVQKGIHAGNIIKEAARVAGGGGGGRPDMAQAGGKNTDAVDEAVQAAKDVCLQQLNH
jgi:alanyl-tRNA synthetase